MKDYELSIVFHPDLEMNIDPALDKVKKTLESVKANITKETAEGKKRLAYRIEKQDFGIYYYFDVQLPANAIDKISNVFNISDEILRYLLVKVDPRREKYATRRAEKSEKAEKAEKSEKNDKSEKEA